MWHAERSCAENTSLLLPACSRAMLRLLLLLQLLQLCAL